MTNFEYWKDKILKITNGNDPIALENGEPIACCSMDCEKCGFDVGLHCSTERIKWLYSEHKEEPKLTMAERILCEAIDFPEYKEITRANGYLFIGRKGKLEVSIKPCMFKFIEEGNPWMVENLLLLEVDE